MPRKENLIGKTFNRLTVIKEAPSKNKKTYWICKCECGNIVEVRADQLKNGNTKSCGCLNTEKRSKLGKSHIKDISNQKFGFLTAIKRLEDEHSYRGYNWECQCDCGNIISVPIVDLINGNTCSCGCQKESIGEKNIASFLIKNNIKFETQKSFKNLKNIQKNHNLYFDFFLPDYNILIEFDGPQHYSKIKNKYSSEQSLKNDQIKNQWCLNNNIKLYRIPYTERDNICKYNNLNQLCQQKYLVNSIDFYNLGLKI